MRAQQLAELMLQHASNLHPEYTREQQMTWAIGMLSDVVVEKNHMDNIIWARLEARIDRLYEQKK